MRLAPGPLAVWRGLPDPERGGRCAIVVLDSAVQHLVDKHVSNPEEPWQEFLGPDLLEQARSNLDEECMQRVAAALEREVRASLDLPLLLACRRSDGRQPEQPKVSVWLIVLQPGLQLVATGRRKTLRTCMFPRVAARCRQPYRRVGRLITQLIWRYAERRPDGLWLPDQEHRAVRDEVVEGATRFLTPDNWGFVAGPSGSVFRGRIPSWKRQLPALGAGHVRPRRPRPMEARERVS